MKTLIAIIVVLVANAASGQTVFVESSFANAVDCKPDYPGGVNPACLKTDAIVADVRERLKKKGFEVADTKDEAGISLSLSAIMIDDGYRVIDNTMYIGGRRIYGSFDVKKAKAKRIRFMLYRDGEFQDIVTVKKTKDVVKRIEKELKK